MGNVATKESRPRSSSGASYSSASGGSASRRASSAATPNLHYLHTDDAAGPGRTRRASSSASLAGARGSEHVSSSSSRHRSSKGKSKKHIEPPQNLVLDTSETVDGGYLQPQGVYTGPQDFKYKVVRQLIIDRKLSPFYKGLNEYKESWSDRQLLAAVRGLPIPPEDASVEPLPTAPPAPVAPAELPETSPSSSPQPGDSNNVTTTTSATSDSSVPSVPSVPSASNTSLALSGNTESTSVHDDSDGYLISGTTTAPNNNNTPASIQITRASANLLPHDDPLVMLLNEATGSSILAAATSSDTLPASTSAPTASSSFMYSLTTTPQPKTAALPVHSTPPSSSISVAFPKPSSPAPTSSPTSTVSPTTRSRANTTSRYGPSPLGQNNRPPAEVLVYRGATECPICFLYYPKYLNLTRCCAQPICTECFVQIKRADPHPPHDDHDDDQSNDNKSSTTIDSGTALASEPQLVSEPACCPYCMLPDFGVTYAPCPYRSGLEPSGIKKLHSTLAPLNIFNNGFLGTPSDSECAIDTSPAASPSPSSTPASSTSALSSTLSAPTPPPSQPARRRGSVPANSPDVVTIDKIRPDWSIRLASARAHAARKSAQATALHASAFLLESSAASATQSRNRSSSLSGRSRGLISGRRNRGYSLSAAAPASNSTSSPSPSLSGSANNNGSGAPRHGVPRSMVDEAATDNPRIQQLEDIMMMEAIRLSLIEEENRKLRLEAAAADAEADRVSGDTKAAAPAVGQSP